MPVTLMRRFYNDDSTKSVTQHESYDYVGTKPRKVKTHNVKMNNTKSEYRNAAALVLSGTYFVDASL